MKVKVNRLLSAGRYYVNFEVGDFTPDELSKMSSFGVPSITLRLQPNSVVTVGVPLNQISKGYNAAFGSEQEAKEYEDGVLAQIRTQMQQLRENNDDFSSSEEVDL